MVKKFNIIFVIWLISLSVCYGGGPGVGINQEKIFVTGGRPWPPIMYEKGVTDEHATARAPDKAFAIVIVISGDIDYFVYAFMAISEEPEPIYRYRQQIKKVLDRLSGGGLVYE